MVSIDTLTHLAIIECPADTKLFEQLLRFRNLRKLELRCVRNLTDENFLMIGDLNELHELHLQGGNDHLWTWNGLFDAVQRSSKLNLLKLKNVWNFIPMNLQIYKEFVQMCRTTNKPIKIEFDEKEKIDLTELVNENCLMIVDVFQTYN